MTTTPQDKLTAYFALFKGESPRDWETVIAPEVDKIYHPDLVAVTNNGTKNRDEIVEFVKGFTIAGGAVEDFSIVDDIDGGKNKIHYKAQLVSGDGVDSWIDNVGTFKDGLLIRIEPADPDAYSRMLERHTNPAA
jgi:hypothetical protein